jgi:hypothetical protein
MLTPHPSLVPLDMAAAGLVTVTNTYENKTSEIMSAISSNIIAVQPTVGKIKEGLISALSKVNNFKERVTGSNLNWSTNWNDTYSSEVMDKIKEFI